MWPPGVWRLLGGVRIPLTYKLLLLDFRSPRSIFRARIPSRVTGGILPDRGCRDRPPTCSAHAFPSLQAVVDGSGLWEYDVPGAANNLPFANRIGFFGFVESGMCRLACWSLQHARVTTWVHSCGFHSFHALLRRAVLATCLSSHFPLVEPCLRTLIIEDWHHDRFARRFS